MLFSGQIPSGTSLAATPMERLRGLCNLGLDGSGKGWLALAGLGLAIAGVAAIGIFLWRQKRRAASAAWTRFLANAQKAGLNNDEQKFLAWIWKLAGTADPGSVFTIEDAFAAGATAMTRDSRFTSAGAGQRQAAQTIISSIRDKLGFHKDEDSEIEGPASSRQIGDGARISVIFRGRTEPLGATVLGSNAAELIIETKDPVEARVGDTWLVRYSDGASVWEFDAPVLSNAGGKVMLGHSDQLRFINRRRFPRVPIERTGHIAVFPFVLPEGRSFPEFVPATMIEIAGPGMRFRSPLQFKVGDRALVTVALKEGQTVEGLAKVRRAAPPSHADQNEIAVEIIGLAPADMAELAAATSAAQAQSGQDDSQQPAEPVAAAAEQAG